MTDKTGYKEVIENTQVKHAWKGQIIQVHLYPGDTAGELYRMTEIQDKPYKTRVISLFFEDKHASFDLVPRPHYLHNENPATIYVEHQPKKQTL